MDTPTNKPLILFDIDETLINTDQLRILQRKTLADTLQKSDEDIANCFIEYYGDLEKTSDFDPDEFLAFASEKFGFPLEKLKDAFFQPTNFQMVLYPEVVETLANLRNKGYTLGIYSQGIRYSQIGRAHV